MADPAVELKDVRKSFDGTVAVRGISLSVPRGSVYGLLGPNGAGKTTTIRMILNIIEPDSGSVTVLGRPATDPGIIDRLGYLPEERGLYRRMQIRRVLRYLAALKGVPAAEANRRIDEWLERFSLADRANAKVEELSRGNQQKIQFIAALVHDPEVVILDEPFSGLDPVNAQALKDTVDALRERGRTVIFSTHIIENAEKMCDSVCIIARGEKILDGPVSDVRTQYGGPPVERTVLVQPSLYDIFLQQVGATGVEDRVSGHG